MYTPRDPSVVTREVQSKHSGVTVKVKVRVRDGALVEGDCSKDEKKVWEAGESPSHPSHPNHRAPNVHVVSLLKHFVTPTLFHPRPYPTLP